MATIPEALALALQHHQAGRLQEAEQIYREILAVESDQADALHLLGVLAHQAGQLDAAIDHIQRAIQSNRSIWSFHYNLARVFQDQRKFDDAVACYRRTLELKLDCADAHNNLGNTLREQGKLDEAVASYRKAILHHPEWADAHNNLGTAYQDQGKLVEAVASFQRALQLQPGYAEAYNNLGNALQMQKKFEEAVPCYQRALEIKPDSAETYSNLAAALRVLGKLDEAIACCRRALELDPNLAEASFNLGNSFWDQRKLNEATACYLRVLELNPEYVEAHHNLGIVFREQGNLSAAVACHRRAVRLKPDFVEAHSNFLLCLLCQSGTTTAEQLAAHSEFNQRFGIPLAPRNPTFPNDRDPSRRLRIGYLSPNFYEHVVGRNVWPLFREHDRARFEVLAYAQGERRDEYTERFQAHADAWRNVSGLTDEALARQVREDRIDVLVDLALHTANNRLLIMARQPAPVQVTFAGYPGTTGLTAMDYRLTDPHLDPPRLHDEHYSEQSFRLPNTFWCYDPLANEPAVNSLPAGKQGYITFGCLNNFCKVNDSVLRLWGRVLRQVERSRLLLMAPAGTVRQATLALLEQEGVAAERVTFASQQPHRQYLELYHQIDIGLDTFPYNGHTTSLDSYWMGVPVITLVGQTVVGRAGLSQLTNLGLMELIAKTPDEFVRIAVELAQDMPRLSQLRSTLRGRMEQSALMDAKGFTRGIEAAYRTMWQRWCLRQT